MVGIVLVSHSRALALALQDLVRQVSTVEVPLAVAAGVGDDRSEFGTDAVEIMEAILSVDSEDGVVVLMDLGSAILSAEMAVEFLPPEVAEHVRFCAAPLVEGAIAAGVQAGLGSDAETICQEAQTALMPKAEQLGQSLALAAPETLPGSPEPPAETAQELLLVLHNLHGLHARPAARFVQSAASFDADIRVKNVTTGKGPVSARSLNALATLGAVKNHQILVSASGVQAHQALEALRQLVEGNFGEPTEETAELIEATARPTAALKPGAESAVPVSEGVALGALYRYQPPLPVISDDKIDDPQKEWGRIQVAIQATRKAIQQRRKQLLASMGAEQTAIFEAHELILQDPDLLSQVENAIYQDHWNAGAAWKQSVTAVADSYRSLDDIYLKQRAVDVMDVGNQVLFALSGSPSGSKIDLEEPVILFAHELTPTETSQLDMSKVLGILTMGGGPTSHSAILARALGIPALSGVSAALESLPPNTTIGLDGFSGDLWINPAPEISAQLELRRKEWLEQREKLISSSRQMATTADGQRIEVVANVGNALDAKTAAENGAEGIGLLRTEFLFLTRDTAPDEEEQYQMLDQIGVAINQSGKADWPILVRTLDVGGDKELPYITLADEANPFLGVRALRLSLRQPQLFMPQLRAILRAGADYRFRIMFPMVANLEEVIQARQYLEKAHAELSAEGSPHLWPIETGIMVEIPAAAIQANVIAPHVDFFSIGTNDLTQYTLAAERGNPLLSGMADALHPAVLHLIQNVVDAAHIHGKWVGVCGELAGDPAAVTVLVGLGVDELSMNPGSVPRAKAIIRAIDLPLAKSTAQKVLAATSAEEARQIAKNIYDEVIKPVISDKG